MSVVSQFTPAAPVDAAAWFAHKLSFETDCADVHHAMQHGEQDFVLLHVIGSHDVFARRHLHRRAASAASRDQCRANGAVARGNAVYCLLRRAALQRRGYCRLKAGTAWQTGKMMLGGLTGWADEGSHLASAKPAT